MTDGSDTAAKNTRTGKSPNASRHSARYSELVLKTLLEKKSHEPRYRRRLTPEDIHARLILLIGMTLAVTFFLVTVGVVYALIFVTQPIGAQAPNDAAFIDLLKTLAIFLTGSLGGVLAGNGLKSRAKDKDTPKD